MGKVDVKVIRPPAENIKSGHIFRPSRAFFYKQAVKGEAALLTAWAAANLAFTLAARATGWRSRSSIPMAWAPKYAYL